MMATPVIGFVVGAGGYLAAQVFADTYSGEMPGPKIFGYFIGTITAATALGLAFMGRKQGYLAEDSGYLARLIAAQPKKAKQDFSKANLLGYHFKGQPIKRAEEYVAELSVPEQKIIEHRLRKALENDYSGAELEDHIERALDSRVSDLSDTIDISDFSAETSYCANCNAAAKITAYDLPVGPRSFCSERCYCMYSGLPVMEPGYYGMEAEQKLSKTECCCGATVNNPCACMKAPKPMNCSATEPKCPCYAAKSAEWDMNINWESQCPKCGKSADNPVRTKEYDGYVRTTYYCDCDVPLNDPVFENRFIREYTRWFDPPGFAKIDPNQVLYGHTGVSPPCMGHYDLFPGESDFIGYDVEAIEDLEEWLERKKGIRVSLPRPKPEQTLGPDDVWLEVYSMPGEKPSAPSGSAGETTCAKCVEKLMSGATTTDYRPSRMIRFSDWKNGDWDKTVELSSVSEAETQKMLVRTMSGRPVSKSLRKMKHDQNITPEQARERKEIRAENFR